MPLMFLPENTRVDESYCSQLWEEAERDGDHQAHDKRNADVTEGSNQLRVFLEKSPSVRETARSQITAAESRPHRYCIPRVKTQIGKTCTPIKTGENVSK